MNKKQFAMVLVVSFIGGIIGGLLSGKIFVGSNAFAKNKNIPQFIEAKEFRVINDSGKTLGAFSSDGIVIGEELDSVVKLNSMGLEVSYLLPNWKYESVTTKITPFGFTYREFSKLDKMELAKNPFGEGYFQSHNIIIGGHDSRALGPAIQLYDVKRQLRVVLGATDLQDKKSDSIIQRPVSSLILFNDKGNVIQTLP